MITEDYIMKKLRTFVESKEGQKVIEEKTGVKDFKIGAANGFAGKKGLKAYGQKMKEILSKHMPTSRYNGYAIVSDEDILVGSPREDKDCYRLDISFRDGSLERESLSPNSDGLYNIVLLYTKGYEVKKTPAFGWWWCGGADEPIWVKEGLTSRAPDDFMRQAVEEFNQLYKDQGVRAELVGEYK